MSPNPGLGPSNSFSGCHLRVFVKCKSKHVSPRCLQDKVPTYQHGIPSLTWSLPSIPDPSLVTSTPPLIQPYEDLLLIKHLVIFISLGFCMLVYIFLECLSSSCLPGKLLLISKGAAQVFTTQLSPPSWADCAPVRSQPSFARPSLTAHFTMYFSILQSALHF